MFWFFVALQTMAPFIHAHAGAVQLNHGRFLHLHEGVHNDAIWHVMAADQHGTEVVVAQGMRLRNDTPVAAADAALAAAAASPAVVVMERQPGAGLPAPPPLHPARLDHAHPYALAPPAA